MNYTTVEVEPFIDQARSSLSLISTQLATIIDPVSILATMAVWLV